MTREPDREMTHEELNEQFAAGYKSSDLHKHYTTSIDNTLSETVAKVRMYIPPYIMKC